jgi:hypothetical protein
MNTLPTLRLLAAALCGLAALTVRSQVVELRATINGAQETPANSSPATGQAIMLYDVAANTYDLVVSIDNMANTATNSHIHEGPVGTAGAVVSPLGAESVYTRTGNTLRATFHGLTYGGDKAKLLQGGAYYNIHSAAFPGGEIRGQLIAQPKKLYATLNSAQEQAAAAAGVTVTSNATGAAVMWFDPTTNKISLRVNVYNFTNTLTNSHYHEAAPGVSGPVVTGLGGASVYTSGGNGFYTGTFDTTYTGDPVKLLTGGAYLNFHSNVYPAGEIRGQVLPSDELPSSRFVNVSSRGMVGTGDGALIQGLSIGGREPTRVLITAKGPSLAAFGLSGVLSDPTLAVYDSAGRQIASNNDVGTVAASSELAAVPGVPGNALESALLIVLPPGNYTAVVRGNNGATGVALLEATDVRVFAAPATATTAAVIAAAPKKGTTPRILEFCELPKVLAAITH